MKIKKYIVMAALAVMGLAVTSCSELNTVDNPVWHMWKITVQGDGVANDRATIPLGETLQLNLQIVPTFVNVVDPVWSSEDESVAKVDENGLVTAMKTGKTNIHVYSEYNPDIFDDLTLIVAGGAVSISSATISQKDAD